MQSFIFLYEFYFFKFQYAENKTGIDVNFYIPYAISRGALRMSKLKQNLNWIDDFFLKGWVEKLSDERGFSPESTMHHWKIESKFSLTVRNWDKFQRGNIHMKNFSANLEETFKTLRIRD